MSDAKDEKEPEPGPTDDKEEKPKERAAPDRPEASRPSGEAGVKAGKSREAGRSAGAASGDGKEAAAGAETAARETAPAKPAQDAKPAQAARGAKAAPAAAKGKAAKEESRPPSEAFRHHEHVLARLREKLGEVARRVVQPPAGSPFIEIRRDAIAEVCRFLKEDPDLHYDTLHLIGGLDLMGPIQVVYHISSLGRPGVLTLKVTMPREDARVPSVVGVWPAANWHERETYDLMGIEFVGHPDLRRIFLPDDWQGHPLRRDYRVQGFYHGIRVPYVEPFGERDGLHALSPGEKVRVRSDGT